MNYSDEPAWHDDEYDPRAAIAVACFFVAFWSAVGAGVYHLGRSRGWWG